jgi:hypothetical protein
MATSEKAVAENDTKDINISNTADDDIVTTIPEKTPVNEKPIAFKTFFIWVSI